MNALLFIDDIFLLFLLYNLKLIATCNIGVCTLCNFFRAMFMIRGNSLMLFFVPFSLQK